MAGDGGSTDRIGTTGQWLGLLLGGLVGAFTFLGIEGDEVGVILRNEELAPGIVAFVVVAALGASVVSVFAAGRRSPWPFSLGLLCLALVPAPLLALVVDLPPTSRAWTCSTTTTLIVLLLVGIGLVTWSVARRHTFEGAYWPTQAVVLLVGIALFSTAVFGGLRLETRSQQATTSPQLAAEFSSSDKGTQIVVAVRVEKVRNRDNVGISLIGARRQGYELGAGVQHPCGSGPQCVFLGGAHLRPNAVGTVQEKFAYPIDASAIQHVTITAELCERPSEDAEGCDKTSARKRSTLDMRIPPLVLPAPPAG